MCFFFFKQALLPAYRTLCSASADQVYCTAHAQDFQGCHHTKAPFTPQHSVLRAKLEPLYFEFHPNCSDCHPMNRGKIAQTESRPTILFAILQQFVCDKVTPRLGGQSNVDHNGIPRFVVFTKSQRLLQKNITQWCEPSPSVEGFR